MTEWLSGVNIPACQLMIGMGVPLHSMHEIVSLFKVPEGQQRANFDKDPQVCAKPPSTQLCCAVLCCELMC